MMPRGVSTVELVPALVAGALAGQLGGELVGLLVALVLVAAVLWRHRRPGIADRRAAHMAADRAESRISHDPGPGGSRSRTPAP